MIFPSEIRGSVRESSQPKSVKPKMRECKLRSGVESCALLGYYTALSGSSVPTFRGTTNRSHLQGLRSPFFFVDFLTLEDGTDTLSRNVGKESPLDVS
jgi:hypothetical protein